MSYQGRCSIRAACAAGVGRKCKSILPAVKADKYEPDVGDGGTTGKRKLRETRKLEWNELGVRAPDPRSGVSRGWSAQLLRRIGRKFSRKGSISIMATRNVKELKDEEMLRRRLA